MIPGSFDPNKVGRADRGNEFSNTLWHLKYGKTVIGVKENDKGISG